MTGTESTWAYGGIQVPREQAKVVVIPVSYDLTASSGPGARNGPRALLQASTNMDLFEEELGFAPADVGVHTMDIVEQLVCGPEAMVDRVCEIVGEVLDRGQLPVLVGGDHSLSIGAFRALKRAGRSATILQLDAHADLREEFQGSPYSHACVMARALEYFPCVQVGIRTLSEPEFERARRERLPLFPARRLRENRDELVREVASLLVQPIYLTIDLDVLDPSIMPSTGAPEPGGLLWEEILWLVRCLTLEREVIGFDLMELAPIPGMQAPDFLAARLLNKVLGYVLAPPRRGDSARGAAVRG